MKSKAFDAKRRSLLAYSILVAIWLYALRAPSQTDSRLNLEGFRLTFHDEFDGPLDVSALGPNSKWIAHTPYNGDFGAARFNDPTPGFPFLTQAGVLHIIARKDSSGWRSGLLSSLASNGGGGGAGFSQRYGYFEARMRVPGGSGTWPAFWLLGTGNLVNPKADRNAEIDVVEFYGNQPNTVYMATHNWNLRSGGDSPAHATANNATLTTEFHRYGVLVGHDWIVWYLDDVERWRQPTFEAARKPLYVLVNYALGAGFPLSGVTNPSELLVDYVRVYALPGS